MRHARKDYDRIQDPDGKIGEHEAVFLLRAQDSCMPGTLMDYATRVLEAGAEDDLVLATVKQALLARKQQIDGCNQAHLGRDGALVCKIPDL